MDLRRTVAVWALVWYLEGTEAGAWLEEGGYEVLEEWGFWGNINSIFITDKSERGRYFAIVLNRNIWLSWIPSSTK